MHIDWAALGSVFGVSLAVTVGLVGLFTLGVVGLAKREAATSGSGNVLVARTTAYACFALCAAAVAYGIHLIVA
ncbi:hypothetical protein ACFYM2_16630 [Streptomyces sp. NPDC006711]|uniref:hypothetical protein n=1 Tax=unclassified Streptomyces TaxID=2593676 RepID=UPI0033061100